MIIDVLILLVLLAITFYLAGKMWKEVDKKDWFGAFFYLALILAIMLIIRFD